MSEETHSFPLFCVDRGDPREEWQYVGPYDTAEEAERKRAELQAESDREDLGYRCRVRPCRRVKPSEIGHPISAVEYLLEQIQEQFREILDEAALEGALPDGAWANWDEQLVDEQEGVSLEAKLLASFEAALDDLYKTRIFVCAPTEEPK